MVPKVVYEFFDELGMISYFGWRFFKEGIKPRYEFREMIRQCYYVGYKSLGLVALTAFIMGLVITIQSRPTLVEFGAEDWLPKMVSVSLVREIAPVITALICAGKVGSGMSAELGAMKVTEQIDAMDVSGTNPFKYLVVTRVFATTFMVPLLVILADAISLYGGYLGCNIRGVVSWQLYWNQVYETLSYGDVLPSIIKTFFFGYAIGVIGCFKGYYTDKGTEGVGKSANAAVVLSSVMVFIIDLIAVQIIDILNLT
ncbi:MAG: MlaE family ABC transporter permease [Bacteroidota bacterium]|jgi:phospholipid/cholesterol/gamma-HCH transport system permease protein|nr:ABC transporter permease [Bacteroidota bacterium]MCA6443370.1 ABC transporter permease [Bacteroidota bacterium]